MVLITQTPLKFIILCYH